MNKTIISMFACAVLAVPAFAISQDAPATRPSDTAPIDKPINKEGAESKPAAKKTLPNIYDEQADATQQIAASLAKAKEDNKRVLIQWGANWCGWCHLLHDAFKKDKDVARELLYEYNVVLVDIGKFDKNMDIAKKYGADLKGVPYLTILDADGKVLANEDTSPLEKKTAEGKNGHDPEKIVNLLKKHQADPLNADAVFRDAMKLAKKDGKAVFLKFGAPWCGYCHRMNEWMAQADIASIFAKDFVITKIDIERMTGGQEVFAKYCKTAATAGIPWFVFVSNGGEVIADSDGPKGNVGCPLDPHEIAWFQEMIKKAKLKITDADIAEIGRTLAEEKEKLTKKTPR